MPARISKIMCRDYPMPMHYESEADVKVARLREGLCHKQANVPLTDNEFVVCEVSMYNEPGYALSRTLQSLALQQKDWKDMQGKYQRKKRIMHVWVIMDGWRKPASGDQVRDITDRDVYRAQTAATLMALAADGVAPQLEDAQLIEPLRQAVERCIRRPGVFEPPPRICQLSTVTLLKNLFFRNRPDFNSFNLDAALNNIFMNEKADYVMIQNISEKEPGTLIPVMIPCQDAIESVARSRDHNDNSYRYVAEDFRSLATRAMLSSLVGEGPTTDFGLYLTVLIKRDNAKKHDSHRVFFEAVVKAQLDAALRRHVTPALQLFLTDVGTLYGPNMIGTLSRYLDKHPRCAACCAHQKIMSFADQAPPDATDAEDAFASFLRSVQSFDFESGLAVFNGLHASMQFLPVLPGPCAFFRADAMTDDLLRQQASIIQTPAHEDGLVTGNLKIAEDRIPSYLVLLPKGNVEANETHWVPDVAFYCESEGSMDEFIPQRRRWLNGTLAGYFWLIFNRIVVTEMLACRRFMAWKIFGLCVVQLVVFLMIYTMPAFFVISGHLALQGGFGALTAFGYGVSSQIEDITIVVFWLWYFSTFVLLTGAGRWARRPVIYWVWYLRMIINAFVMMINVIVLGLTVGLSYTPLGVELMDRSETALADVRVAATGVLMVGFTPFLLTLMHSFASFRSMISGSYAFYLFLPTMVVDFFAYALSRFDDWSWGTKASTSGDELEVTPDARARRSARERMAWKTTIVMVMQNIFMLVLSTTFLVLRGAYSRVLLFQGFIPAGVSLGIMGGSMLYYLFREAEMAVTWTRSSHQRQRFTTPRKRCFRVMAALLRVFVAVGWFFCVMMWLLFAFDKYLKATVSLESIPFFSDPVYAMCVLVAFTCILALSHVAIREATAREDHIVQNSVWKQTRRQRAAALCCVAFCALGSCNGLTVLILSILNYMRRFAVHLVNGLWLCCCQKKQVSNHEYRATTSTTVIYKEGTTVVGGGQPTSDIVTARNGATIVNAGTAPRLNPLRNAMHTSTSTTTTTTTSRLPVAEELQPSSTTTSFSTAGTVSLPQMIVPNPIVSAPGVTTTTTTTTTGGNTVLTAPINRAFMPKHSFVRGVVPTSTVVSYNPLMEAKYHQESKTERVIISRD